MTKTFKKSQKQIKNIKNSLHTTESIAEPQPERNSLLHQQNSATKFILKTSSIMTQSITKDATFSLMVLSPTIKKYDSNQMTLKA